VAVNSSDQDCKNAFLTSVGIMDVTPYADMNTQQTIAAIYTSAHITSTVLKKLPVQGARAGKLTRIAQLATHDTNWASQLGTIIAPLLNNAAEQSLILRDSGLPNPAWGQKTREEQDVRDKALDKQYKEQFYLLVSIKEPQELAQSNIYEVMQYYLQMFHNNTGLSHAMIAKRFEPPIGHASVSNIISGDTKISFSFIENIARAIAPEFEKGIKEGWLNPENKLPYTFEAILLHSAGATAIGKATGTDAVFKYIKASGLPYVAVSILCEKEETWISKKALDRQFYPAEITHIAHAIGPYLRGERKWNGIVEFEEGALLDNHRRARDYLINAMIMTLPDKGEEIKQVLNPLPDTVGPTLKLLREKSGLSQSECKKYIPPIEISLLERNFFNPRCIDENGEVKHTLKSKLDYVVAAIAEGWLHPKEPPEKRVRKKTTIAEEELYPQKSYEEILGEKLGHEVVGSHKGLDAVFHCIRQSGLPLDAAAVLCGKYPGWLSKKRKLDNLSSNEIIKIADVIMPYIKGEKEWNWKIEFEDNELLKNNQIARDYVIDNLRKALPEKEKEINQLLDPLPDTLGSTLYTLRQYVYLNRVAFEDKLSGSNLSMLEADMFAHNYIDKKGDINASLKNRLDYFISVVAAHWQVREQTPGTFVEEALTKPFGRGRESQK